MINILYIGPYRDASCHGLSAINNIYNLNTKSQLHIQPLYLSKSTININQTISNIENRLLLDKPYDVVIQHAPIDYLIHFKLIGLKNYCIPIIEYVKDANKQYKYRKILHTFDKILLDSEYDIDILKNNYNISHKQTKLYNYKANINNESKNINLSYHKNRYKFYVFADRYNIYNIYQTILAFVLLGSQLKNCSLLIVADSDSTAKELSAKLDIIIDKTKIKYIKNYIQIISSNQISYNNIHFVGDCCIDIRNYSNSSIHTNIAKLYNKSTISNENIKIYYQPIIDEPLFKYGNLYQYIDVNDLVTKMKTVINTTPIYKTNNIPTIDNILCK